MLIEGLNETAKRYKAEVEVAMCESETENPHQPSFVHDLRAGQPVKVNEVEGAI